jgi:hypothetical protein
VIESDESLPVERALDSVDDEEVKLDAIVSKAPFSGQPPAQKQKMSKKCVGLELSLLVACASVLLV